MLHGLDSLQDATKTRLLFGCVVAVTFICFIPTLFNELLLTWDDNIGIVNNEQIRQLSFETVRWAFSTFYFRDWLPLVWISFAIEYALWGLNPVGYHLTNNIIHAGNAGLFALISLTLSKLYLAQHESSTLLRGNRIYYCALLAALLFAIHPLRVESVAWAFERKDVLSLFFGLLSLLVYLRYIRTRSDGGAYPAEFAFLGKPLYWLAVIFYCFSLFSKAMLVSLPLVMLIIDWFPLNRFNRAQIKAALLEKAPFILLAGTTSAILMTVHAAGKMPLSQADMPSRFLIAGKSIITYLQLTVWPTNLSHFHLHPGNIGSPGFEYLFPIALCIVITISSFLLRKRWPVVAAVWAVYLVTLLPVLGFTQVSSTAMADRYTYVPGLAISLLAALAIMALADKCSPSQLALNAVTAGTIGILAVSCYLTVRQISYWKDDVSLWSRAIELQPHFSGRMYAERAAAYKDRGEFQKALQDINVAITIATQKKRPKMEELYFERSSILQLLGETALATADYNYALSLLAGER
ncbi:MAG: hypothetical protein CVU66_01240 [Deltaproteobacteria bacterium HGW-Deltaproteobacteria-23]|nr:MAG: hypothetical protein CVU66_01240 [Deltaproteobacteria bacterium HGW-Deltaproteobacteria-23]